MQDSLILSLALLPQARINQCDVSVTSSHHNVLDVGGGPERGTQNAVAVHKHEKPFGMDRNGRSTETDDMISGRDVLGETDGGR